MHWFKIHHGFSSNPKLGLIAHKLNSPRALINSIFIDMLEYASRNTQRGTLEGYDEETASFNLGINHEALRNAVTLLRPLLSSWDEYQQPIDRTNAERQKRYRDKQKQEHNESVTYSNALRNTDKIRIDKKERGSRFALTQLPEDWKEFCRTERPDLNPSTLFAGFADYWIAQPKGVKLDWFATWRNWVRNQKQTMGAKPQPQRKGVITR